MSISLIISNVFTKFNSKRFLTTTAPLVRIDSLFNKSLRNIYFWLPMCESVVSRYDHDTIMQHAYSNDQSKEVTLTFFS